MLTLLLDYVLTFIFTLAVTEGLRGVLSLFTSWTCRRQYVVNNKINRSVQQTNVYLIIAFEAVLKAYYIATIIASQI